jgi:hypothetical protein
VYRGPRESCLVKKITRGKKCRVRVPLICKSGNRKLILGAVVAKNTQCDVILYDRVSFFVILINFFKLIFCCVF